MCARRSREPSAHLAPQQQLAAVPDDRELIGELAAPLPERLRPLLSERARPARARAAARRLLLRQPALQRQHALDQVLPDALGAPQAELFVERARLAVRRVPLERDEERLGAAAREHAVARAQRRRELLEHRRLRHRVDVLRLVACGSGSG